MPAYVTLIRERAHDADEAAAYSVKAREARAGHALTPLAFHGRVETLEGAPVDDVVILEFPSFAEAEAWYRSPAYQEALQYRRRAGDYRVFITEGVG